MKKQVRTPTEFTKSDTIKSNLIAALEKSLGIVSTACKAVGISRGTYYEYLANDPEFKKKVEMVSETVLDFAESKLYKLINDENPAAVFFYLKCKGKDRGYTEKQSIEISGNMTTHRTPLQFFETEPDAETESD